jgi:hypothetical protein
MGDVEASKCRQSGCSSMLSMLSLFMGMLFTGRAAAGNGG